MKTIARILTVALFAATPCALSSVASAATAVCPTHGGQALTIQQVMINFGLYVTPADNVTNAGLSPMEGSYTDVQMNEAASDLSVAIACANAITNAAGNNPNLIPSAALSMSATNRTNYVNDFLDLMEEFHDSLIAYQTGLIQLVRTPAATRNYQALGALKDACAQAADHAHSKLGQEDSFVTGTRRFMNARTVMSAHFISAELTTTTLQSDMHQIGTIFRQISSTDTDASQNSANARFGAAACSAVHRLRGRSSGCDSTVAGRTASSGASGLSSTFATRSIRCFAVGDSFHKR